MSKSEFLKAITYIGILFNKDISKEIVETWYEFFSSISESNLKNAIKELARESKYFPSLQELLNKCKRVESTKSLSILQLIYNDKYFNKSDYGEISDDQAFRNYEKAIMWIEQKTILNWLLEDMNNYINNQVLIDYKSSKLLG